MHRIHFSLDRIKARAMEQKNAPPMDRQDAFHQDLNLPNALKHAPNFSDLYPFQVECIIVSAEDLKIMDTFSSDPYVSLKLEKSGKRLGSTDTIRRNLNPKWDSNMNNEFHFSLVSIKETLLLRVFDANDNTEDEIIGIVKLDLDEMKMEANGQPRTFPLEIPTGIKETSTSDKKSLGYLTIRMTIKMNEEATFNVVHAPVRKVSNEEEDSEAFRLRELEIAEILKLNQSSDAVAWALKDCKLLTGKHLSTVDLYSKEVIHDIVDDGRCLLTSDIEHTCDQMGTQYHFDNSFCQSTRIDVRSGKYSHISPIYVESGKYVFELETNDKVYVLRTLSVYSMWSWIR